MKKIIVIGAGILGASTAYQLARMGADVTIIDRRDQGQATDAAAGIICPWLSQRRNQAWYRLAKAGARFYPELIKELEKDGETDTGYAKVGALSIHRELDKLEKLQNRAEQRIGDAPEMGAISYYNEAETKAQFPLLSEGYQSIHISGAARVDGRALRDSLLRSAQRHGALFIEGDAVIQHKSNHVIGVKAGTTTFFADEVIVCAGAWASALLQPLGITFQVHYQKAQIIHMELPEMVDTESWPVVIPPSDQYLLAFGKQKIVIGATHENDTVGYDTRVTAGGVQEVLNKGLIVASELSNSTLQEVRVGFRPFTPGFLPVFGAIPSWQGLVVANGLGASGLTVGPFIGSQLAKLVLGKELDLELGDYDVTSAIN